MKQTYARAVASADETEPVAESLVLFAPVESVCPTAGPADMAPHPRDDATVRRRPALQALAPEIRPRERLLSAGAEALSSTELLSILFGKTKEKDALAFAGDVISGMDGLYELSRASYHELLEVRGMGKTKATTLLAAVVLGKRLASANGPGRPTISSPADVHALLGPRLAHQDCEHFVVCLLNTKNHVLASPIISIGTLSSSLVHPREVFKPAIKASAASVILAHNHPSGHLEPSCEDRDVTRRLVEAGRTIGIGVLDHVIIGDGYFSMKEHAMLTYPPQKPTAISEA